MNPRVKEVQPEQDYTLLITFNNGEHKLFDVKPYLSKGIFVALHDNNIFRQVKPFNGSIRWPGDLDLCPDTLYEDSITAKS
jgi:hypothetical protein